MRALAIWLGAVLATVIAVAISYQWLDRPIALLMHGEFQRQGAGWWKWLSRIPNPLIPLAIVAFVVLGLRALVSRTLPRYQAAVFVGSVSVMVTEAAKNQLKFLFGRSWPESWIGNNPSFIRDGVYGFHFMHGGGAYNSFPSGHMASTCAVLTVVWFWYPGLRWLCVVGALAVAAGLVGANYHFLSDVIAGGFLGASIGWLTTAIWHLATPSSFPKTARREAAR
jgi:membrane-associated phospholipid phosphatase